MNPQYFINFEKISFLSVLGLISSNLDSVLALSGTVFFCNRRIIKNCLEVSSSKIITPLSYYNKLLDRNLKIVIQLLP